MKARTRAVPTQGTNVIWLAGLRQRWGIDARTLWRWRRDGLIPAPDVHVAGRIGWRPETIERYEASGDAKAVRP